MFISRGGKCTFNSFVYWGKKRQRVSYSFCRKLYGAPWGRGGYNLPTLGWKANNRPYRGRRLPRASCCHSERPTTRRQVNPGCSPEAAPGAEALAPALASPLPDQRGEALWFYLFRCWGERRHLRREKVVVGHKADLFFGKKSQGKALFPPRALRCRREGPALARSRVQGLTSEGACALALPRTALLPTGLGRSPALPGRGPPLLLPIGHSIPKMLGGGLGYPIMVNFVSDKNRPRLGR